MDFSKQLDNLEQHAADAKASAQVAVTETRDKLQQRIDQAQVNMKLGMMDAQQHADAATDKVEGKWAQLKADAAARRDEANRRINQHVNNVDARLADSEAEWAESDASDAIDFAQWAVDNAQVAVLSAIKTRAFATQVAETARA